MANRLTDTPLYFIPLLFGLCFFSPGHAQNGGNWQLIEAKSSPAGRSECGLSAVEGKLYLLGGDGAAAAVAMFDPATQTWTEKATAPIVLHHFQPVSHNGKIYVLGAFDKGNFPTQSPTTHVYTYDTKLDRWEQGAQIPAQRRRASGGAAVHNGKLYLVNGIQYGHSSGTTNMFDEFDPATNRWTVLPDAPHIRDHSMAAVVDDKLYAVGGRNTSYHEPNNFMAFMSKTLAEVDCFDFTTKMWSTLAAKLPQGSGGGTLVALDGKLYYIGGERATATTPNGAQKDVYVLDTKTPTQWTPIASLNKARNGVGGAALNHAIYIAGGAGGPGGPPPGIGSAGGPPPGGFPQGGPPPGGIPGGPPPGGRGDIALEMLVPGQK